MISKTLFLLLSIFGPMASNRLDQMVSSRRIDTASRGSARELTDAEWETLSPSFIDRKIDETVDRLPLGCSPSIQLTLDL